MKKSKIIMIFVSVLISLAYFNLSQATVTEDEDFEDKPELWKETNDWSKLTPEKLLQGESHLNNVNEGQVNSYFSSNYPSYPPLKMNGLNSAELKLAQTLGPANLDPSLTAINNLEIDKQGNLITPSQGRINLESAQVGTNIEYTNEGIKITNNEGKAIIIEHGSVDLKPDNTFYVHEESKVRTNENDIIETTTDSINLYLDKTQNTCENCLMLDSENNHVIINAKGVNLQLGKNREGLTLDIGETQGVNYILDKDSKKAYKIIDGKISVMVNEGDTSDTGFANDLISTGLISEENMFGVNTLNSCDASMTEVTGLSVMKITGMGISQFTCENSERTGILLKKAFFSITGTFLQNVEFAESKNPDDVLKGIDNPEDKFQKLLEANHAELAITKIYKKEIPEDKINEIIEKSKKGTINKYGSVEYSGSSMEDYETFVKEALQSGQGAELIFGFKTENNAKKGYMQFSNEGKIQEKEVDYKLIEELVFYNTLLSEDAQAEILFANIN